MTTGCALQDKHENTFMTVEEVSLVTSWESAGVEGAYYYKYKIRIDRPFAKDIHMYTSTLYEVGARVVLKIGDTK